MMIRHLGASAAAFGLALFAPATAYACGGFFCQNAPMDQSAERIVFAIDEDTGTVDTHVQIFYQGTAEQFAWVVPAPAEPELFLSTDALFQQLQWQTAPIFWSAMYATTQYTHFDKKMIARSPLLIPSSRNVRAAESESRSRRPNEISVSTRPSRRNVMARCCPSGDGSDRLNGVDRNGAAAGDSLGCRRHPVVDPWAHRGGGLSPPPLPPEPPEGLQWCLPYLPPRPGRPSAS